MRTFLTGASGFIGRRLGRELLRRGDQVVALTRRASNLQSIAGDSDRMVVVEGEPTQAGVWQQQLAGSDAVVALAGEPVMGSRWTESFKRRLGSSRIDSMRRVVEAIGQCPLDRRPRTLIAASAVGYYGNRGDQELDESAAPASDFLAKLCADWEASADGAAALGVRVAKLRIGVVLGDGGGALEKMVPPFRAFVGGPLGSGDQYVPWIHLDDVIGLMTFALDRPEASGPINLVSPEAATMRALANAIGQVLHRPAVCSVPSSVLKLMLGESAQVLLASQRVVPKRATALGYRFLHPNLFAALQSILH